MRSLGIAALAFLLAATNAQDKETAAIDYLTQYGYIEKTKDGSRPFVDVDSFSDAVKELQDFAGLKKTGVIDKETQELMQTPRCGFEDKLSDFVEHGSKWPKKDLTYRISKYQTTQGLSNRDVDSTTRQAFSMWQDASALTFQEAGNGPVDIDIRFERFSHGDGNAFDGPGGVLAHAFFPRFGGKAHFDDSENWSVTPYKGNQLLNTLTHEFGHSLGLRHSREKGSIMAPFYKGWDPTLKLEDDDKQGIQAIYGRNTSPGNTPTGNIPTVTRPPVNRPPVNRPTVTKPTVNRPPVNGPTDNTKLCRSQIDAIVQTTDGSSYVFKADKYWLLTDDKVASGYPRKISDGWPGLPDYIDAALTWNKNSVTYFFKGDKYWRFNGQSASRGYPRDISLWSGIPSNLDAAFEWGRNRHLYFFKGSQFWKYDTELSVVPDGYPRSISSSWQNVPSNVDAVLQWKNGKTYFFKGGNYWRLNDETIAVDRSNPAFPRDAGQWWFGCPKKRPNIPFTDATDPAYEKMDTEH